ncbi:MAG: hypothetical protein ACI84C_002894 [Flavobacteriales bacterium]|jgi:hypothetical protein
MTVLPACPFPNAFWFANGLSSSSVVDIHENYVKQSFRNRYTILGVHGAIDLTIPVVGQNGLKIATKEIRITDDPWQRVHWNTIKSAYGKSPFFLHFEDELQALYAAKHNFLVDFNLASVSFLIEEIGLEVSVVKSESYVKDFSIDMRSRFKGKLQGIDFPNYVQTFADRLPFLENASLLDLIFNLGPETPDYLRKIKLS